MLGNRTLKNRNFDKCLKTEVIDNVTVTTKLWKLFCDGPELNATCNDYFLYNNVTVVQGIPGLTSGVISGWNKVLPLQGLVSVCKFSGNEKMPPRPISHEIFSYQSSS